MVPPAIAPTGTFSVDVEEVNRGLDEKGVVKGKFSVTATLEVNPNVGKPVTTTVPVTVGLGSTLAVTAMVLLRCGMAGVIEEVDVIAGNGAFRNKPRDTFAGCEELTTRGGGRGGSKGRESRMGRLWGGASGRREEHISYSNICIYAATLCISD